MSTPSSEQSLGDLVARATQDISQLMRQELALAKAEIKQDVKHAGIGAGLLGGAGFTGLFALLFLSIAVAFALGAVMPLGWGFFIVGVLYGGAAAVLGLGGAKQLKDVGPPERTMQTVKDDIAWAKNPVKNPASTPSTPSTAGTAGSVSTPPRP